MRLRPGEVYHRNPLPRGMGTVLREKLRGKWGYRAVRRVDGRRQTKRFATQAQAYDWLRTMAGYWTDTDLPIREMTLGPWLEEWLKEISKRNGPKKTLEAYRSGVKHFPELGQVRLRELTAKRVQRHLDAKLKAGLSPTTVKQLRNILSGALEAAIRRNLIKVNVVAGRAIVLPATSRRERELWSEAQQGEFLASAEPALIVLLTTGLRSGELRGLKFKDIDLERGLIHVRRQMALGELTDLKTRESRRSVPIIARTRAILEKMHGQPDDLVFPIGERDLQRLFHQALRRAKLPRLRLHDLRAMYLTRLAVQGVPPAALKAVAGHASLTTTMQIYVEAGVSDWAEMVRKAWG